MKKLTVKNLSKVKFKEELEEFKIGNLKYEISYRGGNLGFKGEDVAKRVGVLGDFLPKYFGAHCNYLGGGIRGSICTSNFDKIITEELPKKAEILVALADACARVYENIENEDNLNDDEYPNGETNWEAQGTKKVRNAGIKSAY